MNRTDYWLVADSRQFSTLLPQIMSCDNQCRPVEFVHDELTSAVAKQWHACAFRAWCKYEACFGASRVETVEGKTTSDRINRQTTKPVGGSRLSERLVPEIYRGFQGCRADVYPARCKFRSAFSQIYDLCFSLSSRPLSLPPTGATGVGDEGCGMISHRMRILPWSFKPPMALAPLTTMLPAFSRLSISSAHLQNLHHHCSRLFSLIFSLLLCPELVRSKAVISLVYLFGEFCFW